jgi:PAS domain-containing protein
VTPKHSDNGNGSAPVRDKAASGDRKAANGERTAPNGDRKAANGERRREELADFLRTKRSSLQPDDVGLPDGSRRRTPGLRREEVALLAGVGTTWYTWLEQGRDVRASLDVLEALARALRLTAAERSHLILLGRGEHAKPCKAPAEEVSPTVRRLVENMGPGPTYLLGRRWDYLAWNRAFEVVFGWEPGAEHLSRNHVWLWFMDPCWRMLYSDGWAAGARLVVAKFRADSAKNIGDPAFEELISALSSASPEFRKLWKRHEVAGSGDGRKELTHPKVRELVFDHAVFQYGETGEQRLVVYSPSSEQDTHTKLARLLEDHDADSRDLMLATAVN